MSDIRMVSQITAQSALSTATPTATQLESLNADETSLSNVAGLQMQPRDASFVWPAAKYTASGAGFFQGNPYVPFQQDGLTNAEFVQWLSLAGGTSATTLSQAVYARLWWAGAWTWWSGTLCRGKAKYDQGLWRSVEMLLTNLEQIS